MSRLSEEVVVVTGGASGLGLAIVDRFVEEGARVVIFDKSQDRLAEAASRHGERVAVMAGDVRSYAANREAVSLAIQRFGRLDCAIGNAGVWDYNVSLDDTPEARLDSAFDEMFHINVKGYLLLAKAALPDLVRSGGSLVYTVSNAGFDPGGGGPLYTAAKHAVVGLIRQLAYEFAPAVRVNGVAPGPIATDLRGLAALDLADRSIGKLDLAAYAAPHVPLAVVPTPAEYAGAYVMLASRRDNRAATGGVVKLDTGIAVRGIGAVAGGEQLKEQYRSDKAT